ncbi:MAG: hypothetical protein IJM85_07380 [Clostridia bacterium]|nr:hypothetical protein [Clostridia bacterium]
MRHDEHAYDAIINAPRHRSDERPHMSNYDRAAQFAPFAALTGYDSEIDETARLTSARPALDEDEKHIIDLCLRNIRSNIEERPLASISFFVPDEKKEGGAILTHTGRVIGINEYARAILFEDGTGICIDDITEAEML